MRQITAVGGTQSFPCPPVFILNILSYTGKVLDCSFVTRFHHEFSTLEVRLLLMSRA